MRKDDTIFQCLGTLSHAMRDNINRVLVSVSAHTGEEMWTEDNYNRCKNGDKKGRAVHKMSDTPLRTPLAGVRKPHG